MDEYFMHPLFQHIDFSFLEEAMEFFGFDYAKAERDDAMDWETSDELVSYYWAGYRVTDDGDEYFLFVKPKHESAAKAYDTMAELYPFRLMELVSK